MSRTQCCAAATAASAATGSALGPTGPGAPEYPPDIDSAAIAGFPGKSIKMTKP